MRRNLRIAMVVVPIVHASLAHAADPAGPKLGQSPRYCNPLSLVTSSTDGSPRGVSLGDVTVLRDGGKYYMFCSGGGAWVSDDLVQWDYRRVDGQVPVAPHVAKYKGAFYMSGNNSPLYRASDPLGPYETVGAWKQQDGSPWTGVSANGQAWTGSFDVDIFIDDDNKPYLYFPGRGGDGINVVPLDPSDLSHFAAAPKRLFGFDKSHTWERYGDFNEYSEVSWIEGPWVFKHDGTYYLEYSASGTQWVSYATGVYTSKSPLGPFQYSPVNPILRQTEGVVTGPGHGCAVEGPDGHWWQFYTIVLHNPPGGRRIGMDPIGFDKDGNMFVRGPTSTPQWAPGVVADASQGVERGSLPLSVNKLGAMNARGAASRSRPGHEAAYAIDNSNGTWWEPAEDEQRPSLTLDLSPATNFDPVQLFTIDSCRIMFNTGGRGFGGGRGAGPGGRGAAGDSAGASATAVAGPAAHQYKIEVSTDGTDYKTVLDKTNNSVSRYTEFDEIPPTTCRFVRLTITGWPRIGAAPLGVSEFTIFGKPVEPEVRLGL
jgi:xylan 1,4-beta-xylosidase